MTPDYTMTPDERTLLFLSMVDSALAPAMEDAHNKTLAYKIQLQKPDDDYNATATKDGVTQNIRIFFFGKYDKTTKEFIVGTEAQKVLAERLEDKVTMVRPDGTKEYISYRDALGGADLERVLLSKTPVKVGDVKNAIPYLVNAMFDHLNMLRLTPNVPADQQTFSIYGLTKLDIPLDEFYPRLDDALMAFEAATKRLGKTASGRKTPATAGASGKKKASRTRSHRIMPRPRR